MAFRLAATKITALAPFASGKAQPLPDALIIPPGVYTVHDRVYNVAKEGLYRFLHPGVSNHQRIVFKNNIWLLAASISWLTTHGKRDDDKNAFQLEEVAKREKLVLTCGYISAWGKQLFAAHGIPARVVHGRALTNLNNYNTGHTLLEVVIDGKWTLVDLDIKCCFKQSGRRMSLLEAGMAIAEGSYKREPLARAAALASSDFRGPSGYDYGLYCEINLLGDAALNRWFQRIMHLQIIPHEDGLHYATCHASLRRQAMKIWPNLVHLTPAAFEKKFYATAR